MSKKQTWIIAYDICSPRRLQRVHKLLSKSAFPLQYSVFVADLTEWGRKSLMRKLKKLIDEKQDDVRFYAAPPGTEFTTHGRTRLPDGVMLFGQNGAAAMAGGKSRKPRSNSRNED